MPVQFSDIIKTIESAIDTFNSRGPAIDRAIYKSLIQELKRLDTSNGRIKTTVKNLSIVNSIKNKLNKIILSPTYEKDLKNFLKAFSDITTIQNQYWRQIDTSFKPSPYLKEVRNQAIADTVKLMRETGIAGNAINDITTVLKNNITTGGSYSELSETLRDNIIVKEGFSRSARQVTVDAINQYSAQYTQLASSDLGLEWFSYRNSTIKTTRPFCFAMTQLRYFHITEISRLLRAENLTYIDPIKGGGPKKVPINPSTDLPDGLIKGTNALNFQINRGGYNCGHQVQPVPERNVPLVRRDEVYATSAYKVFAKAKEK